MTSFHTFATHFIALAFMGSALLLLCAPQLAHAQSTLGRTQAIEISPRYPAPGTTFTARLHAYGDRYESVSWTVDGIAVKNGPSAEEITVTASTTPGVPIRIRVQALGGTSPLSIEHIVVPAEIDLVFEGESRAPYFYEGRRVTSSGGQVMVSAVPHLFDTRGNRIPTDSLTFSWSIDNEVRAGGKGVDRFSFSASSLQDPTLSVRIVTPSGVEYERTVGVPYATPVVAFYPISPLYGISRNAVQDSYHSATGEATLRAEPYFASQFTASAPQLEWRIDGGLIDSQSADPYMITLQGAVGSVADVGFSWRNLEAFSQYATGLFRIAFN